MNHADRAFLLSLTACLACGDDSSGPPADTEGGTDGTGSSTSTMSGSGTVTSSSSGSTSLDTGTTDIGSESTFEPETSADSTSTGDMTSTTTSEEGTGSTTAAAQCGEGSVSPVVEACCAFGQLYEECFGYPFPAMYCEYIGQTVEMYGEDCVEAYADLMSCFSTLECNELMDTPAPACEKVGLASHEACPELIPLCWSGSGGGGASECQAEATDCLDGHTYSVLCDTDTCTCSLDGAEVGTFPGDPDSCLSPGFDAEIVEACGFPPGLFEY